MADVARLADVSTATVSLFLSGQAEQLKRVGPDAQLRIGEAVQRLGYVQNKTARHLRLQRTERICVLLPQLGIPYADRIAQDVEAVARRRGFSTIVLTGHSFEIWRRVLSDVEAGLADGIIGDADGLTAFELDELFGPQARLSKARLILHANADPAQFSVVNYDRLSALEKALEHLRSSGRTRLAYMENTTPRANPRAALVRDYAARHASELELVGIIEGASRRETAAAATRDLLHLPRPPDAILVESDFSAVTVIEELQRHDVRVPEDIAVIGCGNAEEGYYCNPRLTTIGPIAMSLTEAAEHLIDLVTSPTAQPARRFVLPWTLIMRESA
jgi:LacI family repressor for deo operon, udp, cdd, tsx, nupC, and nupG